MSGAPPISADRDLDLALSLSSELNDVINAADTKAGLALATLGIVITGATSTVRSAPPSSELSQVVAVATLVVAAVAVALLGATLWPRFHGAAPLVLALPGLGVAPDGVVAPRPASTELAVQAWARVAGLGEIARRKYRWLRGALVVTAVDLALTVAGALLTPPG